MKMRQQRTIEPRSIRFVHSLRDRHWISPVVSNLARMIAKYAAFARAGTKRPTLFDYGLTWRWGEVEGARRDETNGKSQRVAAEFAPSKSGDTVPIVTRPGTLIQRKSLPSAPPADGGFSRTEPHAPLRSPVLSEASPFEASRASGVLLAADRVSGLALRLGEALPRALLLRPTLSLAENPRAAKTLPESDPLDSRASIGQLAESTEQLPARFRFNRTAAPMEKHVDQSMRSGWRRFHSAVSAGIPVSKISANQSNPIDAAVDSAATGFAISSQTSSSRLGEVSQSLGDLRSPMPSLVQTWAPEAFNEEFFWRDIRVNPVGRVGGLPVERKSPYLSLPSPEAMVAFPAPSFDLTFQLPKTQPASDFAVAAVESPLRPSLPEAEEITARSTNSETRPPAAPQTLSVPDVADRVYRLLERRLIVERESRGVFRTWSRQKTRQNSRCWTPKANR